MYYISNIDGFMSSLAQRRCCGRSQMEWQRAVGRRLCGGIRRALSRPLRSGVSEVVLQI